MAKTHSSLTGADLHDNKGIGVETTANFMTISQSTNILSASAASTASFGRFEGSGDSHFSGSVSFGGNMTFGDSASDSVSITADLTSHLIPNADSTYDLGSTSQGWNDLHLGSGGVINLDGGDVTMTHSANLVSIAGGNTRVIRLEIDSASDYIDVDTDLKIIAAQDVVVDPAGGELKVDGNVVPNSDSADSLGASGTAWANLYVDDIDLNGQGSISMGGTGRIDLDADDDTSIRASADDVITFEAGGADEMSLSATSLYPATDDGLALGSASQNWSDLFIADEGVINFGDDQDVSLTHVLDTGLLLSSSDKLQFGDSGTFIHQSGDGVLTIESDTTVDINGAVAFDGNVSGVGTLGCGAITSTGNLAVTGTITGDTSLTLDTTTLTTAELGVLDGVTAGTAAASKALVLDGSSDITSGINNLLVSRLEIDADTNYIDVSTDLQIIAAADIKLDPAGGEVDVDGNLIPNTDSADDLGASGQAWNKLWVDDIELNSQGSITNAVSASIGYISGSGDMKIDGGATFGGGYGSTGTTISSAGVLQTDGAITAGGNVTAVGSFVIGSADMSETDLEKLDGITDGTGAANKALVLDGSSNIASIGTVGCGAITTSGNLAVTGTITGDTSLTLDSTTLTTAELGVLDSVTAGTAAASKALVLDGSKNIATIGTVGCGAITSTGNSSFAGGVTVGGDFTVNGTTVTVDATTLNVADKNITIASGSTTSANMNGAGLNFGLDAAVAQLAYRHSDTTLTSSVDLGAPQFHSSIATGTAPLTVQSTTVVANLNAATVAGKTMAEPGAIGGTTAGAITGTTIDATTDFTIDGLVLTADTITNDAALSVVSTGLTLDASLDIALSADGGNVTMDDGTTTAFDFNVDDVELKIHDDAQVANYASIAVGDNGATTLSTVDADAAIAHLTLDADGDINLDPVAGGKVVLDGTINVDGGVVTGATSITSTALSATSASITYISASKVEVDATSLTIGGTSLNKTVADNISAIDQTVNTTSSPQFAKVNIDSSSDYLDVDTDFKMVAAEDITLDPAGGNVKPASNDDAALGVAGTGWSDLFLAEGAVINWDSGDLMLTQAGDVLTLGGDGSPTLTATLTNGLSITAAGGIGMTSYDASAAVTDLALDIDGMTDIGADLAAGDIFAVDDGAGGTNRKVTIDRIADFVSGSAFSKVSGDVSITGEGVATVTGATTNAALTAGDGISTTDGTFNGGSAVTFALDINELSAATIASGDMIAFSDEATTNDPTKKESIDDIATLFAGTGLTAASAVIGVDAAQLGITSIYATDLIMGEDSDTAIDFGDENNIEFKTNGNIDFKMVAGGTFHANSDVVAYSSTVASDMNLKENITDMKYGLDDIMKLRGVEYDWKREDMGHDVGVLAQEVEAVIPELVKEVDGLNGREGFKAVDYNKLVPVLIESIKELKSEIDELKLIKN